MAKDNEYKRLQDLGQWLQRLLTNHLENWELKALFEDAVEMLDLYYAIPYGHPFFVELDDMTRSNRNWQQVSYVLGSDGSITDNYGAEVGQQTRAAVSLALGQVRTVLGIIGKTRRPWHTCINEILEGKLDLELTQQELDCNEDLQDVDDSIIREMFKQTRKRDSHCLDRLYSNIGDKILITDNGCERVKVFVSCDQNGKLSSRTTTPEDMTLPFDTIIARVFYDFLLMGGQEYYDFCGNCDKFIVAQRKGRLQFCSGKCRVAHKREVEKETGYDS